METRSNKKIALSVLALGGATAAVVFGSWAAWTAQTTNPGNTVTAGELTMDNGRNGLNVIRTNVLDARPGSTSSDTVTLTNDSTGPMSVELTQLSPTDALSDGDNVMKFTIHDGATGNCVYPAGVGACPALDSTTLGADWDATAVMDAAPNGLALPGSGGANWAAAEAHTFTVTWEYTDDGDVNNTNNNATPKTATFGLEWNGTPA